MKPLQIEAANDVYCGRCGRRLRNVKAIELGFGKCCYKKMLAEQAQTEFEKNQQTIFAEQNQQAL